jgi:hypothetical protein
VRELSPGLTAGDAPPVVVDESAEAFASNLNEAADAEAVDGGNDQYVDCEPAPARMNAAPVIGSKPLVPQRYRVEFTASARYVELLEEARDLLQHRVPDRDVTRVHELAMEAFVGLLRKRRRAEGRGSPGAAPVAPAPERVNDVKTVGSALERANQVADRSAPERVLGTGDAPAPERMKRYVPAGVRRAVWQWDEGRCTFEDSRGRRCSEQAGLEVHHEQAFALGGPTTLDNLRLLCRAHNGLLAERDFGRAHVERMKHARDGTGVRSLKSAADRGGTTEE